MIEFNQAVEFPNLFAAAMNALSSNDKSTTEKNYTVISRLIEERLLNILRQLQLSYYFDETTEKLEPDFLFDKFAAKLQIIVTDWEQNNNSAQIHKLKVFVGNELVLAILAYIYKELLEDFTKHKVTNDEDIIAAMEFATSASKIAKYTFADFMKGRSIDPKYYLKRLIAFRDKERGPLHSQFVLGVGNGASIYIELEPRNPDLEQIIKQQAMELINLIPINSKNGLPRIDISIGNTELMGFNHHGGATINLLSLDITSADARQYHIVQPPTVEFNIFNDCIDGIYRYIKGPNNPTPAQIMKAVAHLLAMPFLNIKDPLEIEQQIVRIKDSLWLSWWTQPTSDETLALVNILERNAFYGNAHNRAHRESNGVLIKIANRGLIPIFANCMPINKERKVAGLHENIVNKILINQSEFLEKYCKKQPNGEYTLFHGTKKFDNVLNILKQGFINSISFKQGGLGPSFVVIPSVVCSALFGAIGCAYGGAYGGVGGIGVALYGNSIGGGALSGSGVYTTNNLDYLKIFAAGIEDNSLSLTISNNKYIRAADTSMLSYFDWFRLKKESINKGCFDINDLLSQYYNIDAIIYMEKDYIIIQNANIFNTQNLLDNLISRFRAEQETQLHLFMGIKSRQKEQSNAEEKAIPKSEIEPVSPGGPSISKL